MTSVCIYLCSISSSFTCLAVLNNQLSPSNQMLNKVHVATILLFYV